jgi:ribosomal protein L3 glutamine methyltransferase
MESNTNLDLIFDQAQQQFTTIRDLLRFAVSIFRRSQLFHGHGTTNAYDEAAYLILHSLNLPLDQLEPYLDASLLPYEVKQVLTILQQRVTKKLPAPYLTHEAIFHGYSFYVDERVIIPRSFIAEILLQDGLAPWIEHVELVHNVLDLCTGNGSLAIIAADYFYDSQVVAVDIAKDALDVAQINVNKYSLNQQISLIESNLFTNLVNYQGKFDLILTNPPYVDKHRMEQLPHEYLHEPRLALAGGDSGLELVEIILKQAKDYLSDYGILVVEMGDNRQELEELYPELPFVWLDTASGDGFVFVLTKQDLANYFFIS